MMDIYYTIEPDDLTVGLLHVVYKDKKTHDVLGGWDTVGTWDEVEARVQKCLPKVAATLAGEE